MLGPNVRLARAVWFFASGILPGLLERVSADKGLCTSYAKPFPAFVEAA